MSEKKGDSEGVFHLRETEFLRRRRIFCCELMVVKGERDIFEGIA